MGSNMAASLRATGLLIEGSFTVNRGFIHHLRGKYAYYLLSMTYVNLLRRKKRFPLFFQPPKSCQFDPAKSSSRQTRQGSKEKDSKMNERWRKSLEFTVTARDETMPWERGTSRQAMTTRFLVRPSTPANQLRITSR